MGERIWVDLPDCRSFVDNILTAFETKLPPKNLNNMFELGGVSGIRGDSPVTVILEEDQDSHMSFSHADAVPVSIFRLVLI